MSNRFASISYVAGIALLSLCAGCFLVPTLLFACGIPILPLHLWLAAGLALATAWFAARERSGSGEAAAAGKLFAAGLAAAAAMFAVCFVVSGWFYDLSYDGQAYHQESILHLAGGWNPVYDGALSLPTGHGLWVNHYGRGGETAAAVLFKATGLIEHSKALNALMITASFLLSAAALHALKPDKPFRWLAIAMLLALNPVSIYQVFSFYVDGLIASLLLCLLALGLLMVTRMSPVTAIVYTAGMIWTMNIKFTAIAYAGLVTIGVLAALYMSEQFAGVKRLLKFAAIGGIAGVLLFGYNPFVTNTLNNGHPFYPLAGEGAIDVVESFTPRNLETMNRAEQAVASYFAETRENSTEKIRTKFKWPFTFSARELSAFAEPDVAVSGFGPLFSGALLLSLAVMALAFRRRLGWALIAAGVMGWLVFSALINPGVWWARYVPQLWFVPLVAAWLGISLPEGRLVRGVSWALVLVLAVNALLVGGAYTVRQTQWNQTLREQLAVLKASPGPVSADFAYSWSNRERFRAAGIAFKEEELACGQDDKLTLIKSGTTVCLGPGSGSAQAE